MAGNNAIAKFTNPKNTERDDAAGITAFGRSGGQWSQIINGLVFQGGKAEAGGTIQLIHPLQKQLLYLNVSVGTYSAEGLARFTCSDPCYYLVIGV